MKQVTVKNMVGVIALLLVMGCTGPVGPAGVDGKDAEESILNCSGAYTKQLDNQNVRLFLGEGGMWFIGRWDYSGAEIVTYTGSYDLAGEVIFLEVYSKSGEYSDEFGQFRYAITENGIELEQLAGHDLLGISPMWGIHTLGRE